MEDTSLPFELPRVAVVITCYNYRSYVERAIRSVLAQTYRNWDCVIVDDASTDGSAEHVRQLLQVIDDPRLRQLVRQDNGGQIAGFRDGFAATDAPFIAFLDADDVWLPDFLLAHLSTHLNTTHSAALSSSDVFLVDGNDTLLAGTFLALRKPRSGPERNGVAIGPGGQLSGMAPGIPYASQHPVTYFAPNVSGWLWSPCSAILYRRGALEPVLSFPFKAKVGTDYLTATCAHMPVAASSCPNASVSIACTGPTYLPALPLPVVLCCKRLASEPTGASWLRMSSIMCWRIQPGSAISTGAISYPHS